MRQSVGPRTLPCGTYLLTFWVITICYRSWRQLICDVIHHELLQLGANFGYSAFLDSHPPVSKAKSSSTLLRQIQSPLGTDTHRWVRILGLQGSQNVKFSLNGRVQSKTQTWNGRFRCATILSSGRICFPGWFGEVPSWSLINQRKSEPYLDGITMEKS